MIRFKYNEKYIVGFICWIVAGISLWDASQFEGYSELGRGIMGANFFPAILAYGLIVCGFLLLYSGYKKPKKLEVNFSFKSHYFLLLISLVLYYWVMPFLGYLLTSFLFVATIMWFFGVKHWQALTNSIIIVAIVYVVFQILMKVQFPPGVLL